MNLILLLICLDYFLIIIIFLDLILLTIILWLIIFSILSLNASGYIYGLLILAVAAADTAVGLGLFIIYYKATGITFLKF